MFPPKTTRLARLIDLLGNTFLPKTTRLALLITLIGVAFTSCIDEESPDFLLSTQVNALSHILIKSKTCDEKTKNLRNWIQTRESILNAQRDDFQSRCASNKPYYMQCISYHMIVSAKVETAISSCPPTEDLSNAVEQLNRIAYTGVRILPTAK